MVRGTIIGLFIGCATAVAGCGPSAPAPVAASTPAPTASATAGYGARLAALTERERAGVLFRAIRDAGRDCQGVTASTQVGEADGAPAWLATCDNGPRWVVSLRADGTAIVTDPRHVRAG